MKQNMTAPRLRIILLSTIGLMIALGIGAFLFFEQRLSDYARQVNNDNTTAAESNQDVAMLKRLKGEMDNNQIAVNRAASIVAGSQHYQYQNQIIDDLNAYANTAGFTITSFSFTDSSSTGGAASGAPATLTSPATPVPAGLKSTTATITLPSTISYQSIMNFLKAIEENLTKMDLTGVTMQMNTSTNTLTISPIAIKVYTK